MKIYHYNHNGVYICESEARKSPLEKGVYLIPARATKTEPPATSDGEEAVFKNGEWTKRLKKTEPPSKYHSWDDKEGWFITADNQELLDAEAIFIENEKKKQEIEVMISGKMRELAISELIKEGKLESDFK